MGDLRVAVIGTGVISEALVKNLALLGVDGIDAIGGDFWETLSLGRLQDYECAVTVVDDPESRLKLNQMCLIAGTDLVTASVDGRWVTVECFPFGSSANPACLECNLPDEAYVRIAECYTSEGLRRKTHAVTADADGVAPFAADAAGAAAAEAAHGLSHEESPPARRRVLDAIAGTSSITRLERREQCPVCEPFQMTPRVVRTRNRWSPRVEGIPGDRQHVDQALRLSDGLITRYECKACGPLLEAANFVNRRAAEFDDSITQCPRCGAPEVHVEIRDTFLLGELMERFGDTPVPAKYATTDSPGGPVCFDLEAVVPS